MSYGEVILVGVVALVVLRPKELQACAFYCAKAWKAFQSTKALIHAELTKTEPASKDPHD